MSHANRLPCRMQCLSRTVPTKRQRTETSEWKSDESQCNTILQLDETQQEESYQTHSVREIGKSHRRQLSLQPTRHCCSLLQSLVQVRLFHENTKIIDLTEGQLCIHHRIGNLVNLTSCHSHFSAQRLHHFLVKFQLLGILHKNHSEKSNCV